MSDHKGRHFKIYYPKFGQNMAFIPESSLMNILLSIKTFSAYVCNRDLNNYHNYQHVIWQRKKNHFPSNKKILWRVCINNTVGFIFENNSTDY